MHFYEKLTILIVLFIGVTIATGGIIGTYISLTKEDSHKKTTNSNSLILDHINLF